MALRRERSAKAIVDTSAITAALKGEAEAERCFRSIVHAGVRRLSAANLVEAYMVIDRSDLVDAMHLVDRFLTTYAIEVVPVTEDHARLARNAFHRFGRNSGHGARLNYGDCFAYALAKGTGEPLLFVGNDFGQTDIGIA